ncbi:hypothetical protein F0562_023388 [Nyssa sinensis]|uniref:C2 tensin-type domain-containing protein n=1 Tax=Nyssa sinensis TaxID=561372 RepID=A0A5J5BIK2_9ASTE|nr:hypothetical protein F0562_023388 [Nyssa sinensis]
MVYKQAPRQLLHLLSPLNPQPSQLRYLQYISRRNFLGSVWPPSDTPLALDCIILKVLPLFDGGKGCRPVVRVYGQDTSLTTSSRSSKLLFATSKTKKKARHYRQAECALVKIDIHCRVRGDVVLECIHLDDDLVREEMMFRVMFHTAFVKSNVLMLNRDEVDVLWDAKVQFPKDFKAEVLFSDADAIPSIITTDVASEDGNETESASPEEFFEVEEIFSNVVDGQDDDVNHKQDGKVDSNFHEVKAIALDDRDNELDSTVVVADVSSNIETKFVTADICGKPEGRENRQDREETSGLKNLKGRPTSNTKPAADSVVPKEKVKQQEPHGTVARQAKPNAVSRWIPPNKGLHTNLMHVSYPPSMYNIPPDELVLVTDSHAGGKSKAPRAVVPNDDTA